MNIFYLDGDPTVCASLHCDKHVVKMILESAQMLSTAHRELDGDRFADQMGMYKKAHLNHPSTKWVRETHKNYRYLYKLFVALCDEYTYRYGKVHLTDKKLRHVLRANPMNIPVYPMTKMPQCMPDYCKQHDSIKAYHKYYRNEKKSFAKWTKRPVPSFME